MRKIISVFIFMFLLFIVGCSDSSEKESSTTTDSLTTTIDGLYPTTLSLDNNQSLAFSAYLSGGILNSMLNETTTLSVYNQQLAKSIFLSESETNDEEPLVVESDLDEVNVYFDKLKVFMDNGVQTTIDIQEEDSTNENYDKQVTYSIEGVSYTIYYTFLNETEDATEEETTTVETETTTDEVTTTAETETTTDDATTSEAVTTTEPSDDLYGRFHIIGLIVIGDVFFELEGYSVIENGEEIIFFETIEQEDSNNYVRVKIKYEEGFQKFDLTSVIDGVESRSDIKFIEEENVTKVHLRLYNGEIKNTYQFKKIVEDGKTLYMLNYDVDGTKGVIKIFVSVDENGETIYRYQINEAGRNKEVEKGKSKAKEKTNKNNSA